MKTMLEILEAVGAEDHDIENWVAKVELRTHYEPAGRGRPRKFSRENVLELAFLAAYAKCGVRVSIAAAHAHMLVRHTKHGPRLDWVMFAAGAASGKAVSELTIGNIEEIATGSPHASVVIIAAGEIRARVNKLFEGD